MVDSKFGRSRWNFDLSTFTFRKTKRVLLQIKKKLNFQKMYVHIYTIKTVTLLIISLMLLASENTCLPGVLQIQGIQWIQMYCSPRCSHVFLSFVSDLSKSRRNTTIWLRLKTPRVASLRNRGHTVPSPSYFMSVPTISTDGRRWPYTVQVKVRAKSPPPCYWYGDNMV